MLRIFNAVGHGGFSIEEFENFTMVYDCGGKTIQTINHEIKHSLTENQIIDVLFISHFHRDHVNGLKFLLEKYQVKREFLPYLYNNHKIQLLVENAFHGYNHSFTNSLIVDPQTVIQNHSRIGTESQIIFIQQVNNNLVADNASIISIEELAIHGNNINSGSRISISISEFDDKWFFIPFNFEYSKYSNKIEKALSLIGVNIGNIQAKLKTDKDRIINIYKTILKGSKNFNSCSLVLYSGTENLNSNLLSFNSYGFPYSILNGCLYLGDYNAKGKEHWDELYKAYNSYWNNLGTIQVPHHGSSYNYNNRLNSTRNLISIMCANSNGKHPHASTVKSIVQNYGVPIIVTEEPSSRFIEKICSL